MSLEEQLTVSGYMVLAAVLSMIIGLDRERRDKPAGLRTHMLVGVGACLFTALSYLAFPDADSSRVAANVVTGIGFLGAGVIYQSKDRVHDLTTAASIWLAAAIGMIVGVGAWLLALIATAFVWFILDILWRFRHRLEESEKIDMSKTRKNR
ncbi:MAG: MgtC/SapB family protein [Chloroflexi bacterium]|nr:MgtC/SapB family protein [Chloroflexota bacterium]